jgi:hypothetical protein
VILKYCSEIFKLKIFRITPPSPERNKLRFPSPIGEGGQRPDEVEFISFWRRRGEAKFDKRIIPNFNDLLKIVKIFNLQPNTL